MIETYLSLLKILDGTLLQGQKRDQGEIGKQLKQRHGHRVVKSTKR